MNAISIYKGFSLKEKDLLVEIIKFDFLTTDDKYKKILQYYLENINAKYKLEYSFIDYTLECCFNQQIYFEDFSENYLLKQNTKNKKTYQILLHTLEKAYDTKEKGYLCNEFREFCIKTSVKTCIIQFF